MSPSRERHSGIRFRISGDGEGSEKARSSFEGFFVIPRRMTPSSPQQPRYEMHPRNKNGLHPRPCASTIEVVHLAQDEVSDRGKMRRGLPEFTDSVLLAS